MGWKKREKELSLEEAIELAKKELAPHWFNSNPQFAALQAGKKTSLYPLNPTLTETSWLFFFLEPTHLDSFSVLIYIQEWLARYQEFDLSFFLVLKSTTSYGNQKKVVDHIIDHYRIKIPVVLDHNGLFSKSLGVTELPHAVFQSKNRTLFSQSGMSWFTDFENTIQKFLRENDPGLPLFPFFSPSQKLRKDQEKIEFPEPENWKIQSTDIEKSEDIQPEDGIIYLFGEWKKTKSSLKTSDPHAFLVFKSPYPGLSVVAKAATRTIDIARIAFEVGDTPVYEIFSDSDIQSDDLGRSVVEVSEVQIYHAIKNLKEENRKITLSFPTADRVAVKLHGFRLSTIE